MTPFRSEKNTNWEGAFRIPMMVRWPGKIKPGQVSTEIVQHHDWFPTFMAIAGDPDVPEKLKKGYQACGRTYKNHIDGFNLVPYLTGKEEHSPRKLFMYISDDGDILGVRYDNWKIVFMEQRLKGTMGVWAEPFVKLRLAKFFNLRTDPYEFADITSKARNLVFSGGSSWEHDLYAKVLASITEVDGIVPEYALEARRRPHTPKDLVHVGEALSRRGNAAIGIDPDRGRARQRDPLGEPAPHWPRHLQARGPDRGDGTEHRHRAPHRADRRWRPAPRRQ
jgi:hypothetical protein